MSELVQIWTASRNHSKRVTTGEAADFQAKFDNKLVLTKTRDNVLVVYGEDTETAAKLRAFITNHCPNPGFRSHWVDPAIL